MADVSMEIAFREQVSAYRFGEKKSILLSKEDYFSLIDELKTAAACGDKTKTSRQYYILRRYEVLQCGDVEKLIRKRRDAVGAEQVIYYVHIDEMFDIIMHSHRSTGHGGRDKMLKELSKKYANITREVVELFKSLCVDCQKKRKRPTSEGVVVKPLLANEFSAWAQVDLIDMQSMPTEDNNWMMVYQGAGTDGKVGANLQAPTPKIFPTTTTEKQEKRKKVVNFFPKLRLPGKVKKQKKSVTDEFRQKRKLTSATLTADLTTMPSPLLPTPDNKELDQDFMLWFALDMEPLSMVRNNGLNYFFGKNFADMNIPDESTLWRKHVTEVYNAIASGVRYDLANASSIGLMIHEWTDKSSGTHYIGLRAQFIQDDWTGRVVTLSVKPCAEDVSSIIEHLKTEVNQFIPDHASKELYATHDGTDTMIKVSEALRVRSWNCGIEHALHLLLTNDSLRRIPSLMSVLQKCRSIVRILYSKLDCLEEHAQNNYYGPEVSTEFMDSVIGLKKLFDAELCYFTKDGSIENIEADSCNLLAECENIQLGEYLQQSKEFNPSSQNDGLINWLSSLNMIKTLLGFQSEVSVALNMIEKPEQRLEFSEWILVEQLSKFLDTFLALSELVTSQTTSLSLIPLIRAEIADSCKVNSAECKELNEARSLILKNLDRRFPVTSSAKLATLLDPAAKGLCGLEIEAQVDLLNNAVSKTSKSNSVLDSLEHNVAFKKEDDDDSDSRSSMTEANGPLSKKMKLIQKHTGSCVAWSSPQYMQREEIRRYLKYNAEHFDDDPLSFWKKGQFPLLGELAKSILTQSASAALADNIFSTAEILLSAKRSGLPPYRANYLSFIRDNFSVQIPAKLQLEIKQENH